MVNIIKILMGSLRHLHFKVGIGSFLMLSLFLFSSTSAYAKDKTYGPVRAGQTLWVIAYKTRPRGISRLRMMKALHRYNPSAFEKGNINLLKKGATLRVPTSKRQIKHILSTKASAITKAIASKEINDTKNVTEKQLIVNLQRDLINVKKELLESRETLKGLKDQEAQVGTLTAQFKTAQQEIKQLQQKNTKLLKEHIAPSAYEAITTELNALKKQNQVLTSETENTTAKKTSDNAEQSKFTQTVAALNADIGLLKNRIHELENIEQLKDNHITQLQKSLDHATVVIKNQAAVNKRIFDQLNALELAQKTQPIQHSQNETPIKLSSSPNSLSLSAMFEQVSPRFWLIITLSILLLVLALLWRQMFPKNNFDALS